MFPTDGTDDLIDLTLSDRMDTPGKMGPEVVAKVNAWLRLVARTIGPVGPQIGAGSIATLLPLLMATTGGTFTGDVTVDGLVTVAHDPTDPLDVATKGYTDAQIAGVLGAPIVLTNLQNRDTLVYDGPNTRWVNEPSGL